MIAFTIPAVPVAQPRQRHTIIAGHVANYTPSRHPVQAFKATCRLVASQTHIDAPLEGPLRITVDFVLPRPASTPKRRTGRLPHAKKPDVENLAKSLFDALSEIVWHDDRQIHDARLRKWVAASDEQPHVELTVEEVT